ncbi:hypothetical protein HMPREF3025_05415 [Neisseria sp. HMSC070E12]|uniref:hypothetical protein n=1 Tax=Neisseria mucosa TaxID=488 RepID=UPI0008A5F050|nr:hypothetical protein [Neisseria mucosa]OFN05668.1 hypothetical protein HMPREF2638_09365 [Neisseria sp. HMSC055F11]OHR42890.1 hypothetical protein HMPREF3025_05415 [Neisseria sp. HMSC070E12]
MADRQVKNGIIRRFRRPENAKCAVSANCKHKAAFRRHVGVWGNGKTKKHQQPIDMSKSNPTETRRFQTTSNSPASRPV